MKLLQKKQTTLEDLSVLLENEKIKGKKVALCLGVFDLVHPGHIKHLIEAKKHGDILVVAVTANRFVNKGPDRPVFDQNLRMESVAAIDCVDYVVLNDHQGGIEVISKVKPTHYIKGIEYKKHADDLTGMIKQEAFEVKKHLGQIIYTDDVVFSSSKLLNTYFNDGSKEFQSFIKKFKQSHSSQSVIDKIESLKNLKVLVIGDAIIDEYVYVDPLGVSGKGTHLVARCKNRDIFLGGSFAVANHVAAFTPNVTLLSAIGTENSSIDITKNLKSDVTKEFICLNECETLVKRRYVQKDGVNLSKLFETYSSIDNQLNENQTSQVEKYLDKYEKEFDLIIVCDFGNGFINPRLNQRISKTPAYLALNAQINSGNRGYHVVTKYDRADYISINEPELRLTEHDQYSDIEKLIQNIAIRMKSNNVSVTRGTKGAVVYDIDKSYYSIPALTQKVVDRVGAGDSYLALSSLFLAMGYDSTLAAFVGSAAAAMDVQIIGNKKCIEKAPLSKYIKTLLK